MRPNVMGPVVRRKGRREEGVIEGGGEEDKDIYGRIDALRSEPSQT